MIQQVPPQIWQQWQVWMPLVLIVLANRIVVMFGVAWNDRHIDSWRSELNARIDSVRADIVASRAGNKQNIAELALRIVKEILEVKGRVERLEDQRGLIQQH